MNCITTDNLNISYGSLDIVKYTKGENNYNNRCKWMWKIYSAKNNS